MKTTKKIIAALLAVMMIAMMVPFTASAATKTGIPEGPYSASYTFTVDVDNATAMQGDYTFSLYKVASFANDDDAKRAKYTAVAPFTAVQSYIDAGDAANVLSTADDVENKGTAVKTSDVTVNGNGEASYTASFTDINEAGIYLVVCTSKPATVTKASSSLAVLPFTYEADETWTKDYSYTDKDGTVLLNGKLSASPVNVEKVIDTPATDTYLGLDDSDVAYTLTASITGSLENQLTKFVVVDTIDSGLTIDASSFEVYLEDKNKNRIQITDYTATPSYKYKENSTDTVEKTATYGFEIAAGLLDGTTKVEDKGDKITTFYDYSKVIVKLKANLNADAAINTDLENSDGLVYGNADGSYYEDGDTVSSKTFGAKIFKTQANGKTPLEGAKFTVYTDAAATKALTVDGKEVTATSGADGYGNFKVAGKDYQFDADKTYYVKETAAPTGYNISTEIFTLTIDKTVAYTTVSGGAIKNYPVVVPQTGGMGTMIFTIVGLSLIACAGVLFVVVRRKKASK